jgi:uridine phosphorylase
VKNYPSEIIGYFSTLDRKYEIYKINFNGVNICLAYALLGGPNAAVIEELVAMGCKKFLLVGSGGELNKEIARGKIIIISSAVRDEGTSYHYIKPSREIGIDPTIVGNIEYYFEKNKIPYITGKTWTTDAFYRETKNKYELRKSEGCICVEMECAGFAAVAQYNNAAFAQIIYGGDCLDGIKWDMREWSEYSREERRYWILEQSMEIIQAM